MKADLVKRLIRDVRIRGTHEWSRLQGVIFLMFIVWERIAFYSSGCGLDREGGLEMVMGWQW